MNNLLVSAGVAVDIVFFVVLAVGLFFGVKNGFVRGICAIAGTILSLAIAITCCRQFQAFIDTTLGIGLTEKIQSGLCSAIPSETVANSVGEWIAIALCFIVLTALVRLLFWLVGKLGKALVTKIKFFRVLDHMLGGILGLLQGLLLMCIVLAIFQWIPVEALHDFIDSSSVVSKFVQSDWFQLFTNFPALIIKDPAPVDPGDTDTVWNFIAHALIK